LEIRVRSTSDKDSSDEEQKSFSQVDKAACDTVCATFDESASDAGSQRFVNGRIESGLEYAFKSHTADATDVDDSLYEKKKS
jgi:hypothetical protein